MIAFDTRSAMWHRNGMQCPHAMLVSWRIPKSRPSQARREEAPRPFLLQSSNANRALLGQSQTDRPNVRKRVIASAEGGGVGGLETAQDIVASGPAANDPVVTVLFGFAIAALSIITLGVAYLSLTSWRDSQVENQDRQRSRPSDKSAVGKPEAWITSGGGNQASKKNPQKARTDKGFGRK